MDRKSEYAKMLLDPRWQRKRLEILERDGWACTICGDKEKTLHVHHMHYLYGAAPWEYENGYLSTLCEDCHEEEGACKKNEIETLRCAMAQARMHSSEIADLVQLVIELSNLFKRPAKEALGALCFLSHRRGFLESAIAANANRNLVADPVVVWQSPETSKEEPHA